MQPEVWNAAEDALSDLDFPATREQLVAHAERRAGSPDVVRLLRALPLATYQNVAQVRRSVRIDPAAAEGQSPGRKAEQVRSPHSHRIAEQLRTVEEPPVRRRGGV